MEWIGRRSVKRRRSVEDFGVLRRIEEKLDDQEFMLKEIVTELRILRRRGSCRESRVTREDPGGPKIS